MLAAMTPARRFPLIPFPFRKVFRVAAGCLLVVLPAGGVTADSPGPPPGFRPLFNGRDLSGWWGADTEDPREWMALPPEQLAEKRATSLVDINTHWSVVDGELVNGGEGLFLTTDEHFGDYELRLEYRTVAGADSGIYLKGCPQVQIWDTTESGGKWELGADRGSGGLWNNRPGQPGKDPLVLADRPFGEWNQFRIRQCGARTWVWLNGQSVVEGALLENYFNASRAQPIPVQGPIQLQTHGGEIRWRNIFVREIEPAEANQWLRERASAGFTPIFNGRDLTGWQGARLAYAVADGELRASATDGGPLYTEAVYDDFVVRLEFKLPPGGNNGLAIRFPGSGDPAYAGMTELQILDDTAAKHARLDPRQYHGSAYGMVPAWRGYLRERGEWNFQEVTVRGSTVRVELNGNVILHADLQDVTSFLGDKSHPGKDRTAGHFGLAGHASPVAFRHLSLRTLP